jgi:hypothetical protein
MATTYELIDKTILGSSQAIVTFTIIPQTFTDLKLVYSARTNEVTAAAIGYISFNNSSSNFTNTSIQGSGSGTPASFSIARFAAYAPGTTNTANTFSNGEIYIPNYTVLQPHSFSGDASVENNGTEGYNDMFANLWSPSTAAEINRIDLATTASDWLQYSSFYLYGIKNS